MPRYQPQESEGIARLAGAGGRALLHDLDTKFGEMDRLIKYLMNHNSNLEE